MAAQRDEAATATALRELLSAYWQPLYCFARRRGQSPSAAEDAVQSFFARLLERDFLQRLDPGKGRLRSYLRTSFDHFLANEAAREGAQRRSGGIALDLATVEEAVADDGASPEKAFERAWAARVMERAMARLQKELAETRRPGAVELARLFFGSGEPPSYADAARDHQISIPALKTFLHRTRARYRDLVREEVADTVGDSSEVESELADLLRLLSP